jgi:hypothetical protein
MLVYYNLLSTQHVVYSLDKFGQRTTLLTLLQYLSFFIQNTNDSSYIASETLHDLASTAFVTTVPLLPLSSYSNSTPKNFYFQDVFFCTFILYNFHS